MKQSHTIVDKGINLTFTQNARGRWIFTITDHEDHEQAHSLRLELSYLKERADWLAKICENIEAGKKKERKQKATATKRDCKSLSEEIQRSLAKGWATSIYRFRIGEPKTYRTLRGARRAALKKINKRINEGINEALNSFS